MTPERPAGTPRADAQRNRTRLLDAAAEAFAETDGATLDSVAKRAGLGIGTLYRHFPTREALVEAVYRVELERLCDSAERLLDDRTPEAALREWMARYREFVATKRGMADALQRLAASGAVTRSETGPRLTAAIQTILDAGRAAGTLRGDVRAEDVTAALTGTLLVAGSADQQDQAGRLIGLLIDGLITTRSP
jgi:AcrR family transcriptional regulator